MTHIPLSRPDSTNCGPLRESGTIRRGVGIGYQNTLGKDSSAFLLEKFRPSLIFRLFLFNDLHGITSSLFTSQWR